MSTVVNDAVPVEFDEYVFRRVHVNYYLAGEQLPIQLEAFRPTENDVHGISVYRSRFVTPAQVVSPIVAEKRSKYYVAKLAVSDLKLLGLTVIPDPRPPIPGHSNIPELSLIAYTADKALIKDILRELAKLASLGIVHTPSPPAP